MRTLRISKEKALELYKNSSDGVKAILEESFGEKFFQREITDRIKTYEDACVELGISPLNETKLVELGLTKNDIAYQKLATIIKALNEGWQPDVCNSSVDRWYPWFKPNASPSSFAFCDSDCDGTFASAGSGSRLCLKNIELSDYCGKQFIDLWKEFIL